MPEISVILPAYNCGRYLPESIGSVLFQTFRDLELLVIDDGSSDDTKSIVDSFAQDKRLIYIRKEHLGLPSARNTGIESARGTYLAFIDGDDIFLKEKLERQADILKQNDGIDVVYTLERYFDDRNPSETFPSPYEKLSGDLLFFLKRSNFIHVSTVMVKRASIGGIRFDASLKSHEDWDFFLRLAARGLRFYYLPEALSLIRVRKDSMTVESRIMDHSRQVVGERGRMIWKDLKSSITVVTGQGRESLARYIKLKTRAALLRFPNSPKFNRPVSFRI